MELSKRAWTDSKYPESSIFSGSGNLSPVGLCATRPRVEEPNLVWASGSKPRDYKVPVQAMAPRWFILGTWTRARTGDLDQMQVKLDGSGEARGHSEKAARTPLRNPETQHEMFTFALPLLWTTSGDTGRLSTQVWMA